MSGVLLALGGLGLFLIGMQVLTEGLKGLAGTALRRLLVRFTRTPASGAMTGAITTAVIQSSSATTVTAVGFVGAGLLTFPQALGIIFGANIGTTITGWMVALIGFKLQLTELVMPLVLVGAFLRLFGTGRLKHLGWALAGFSLLFIGIDALQQGMAAYEDALTPASFPDDTLMGRLQLVLLGILITIVTQSSSAGVATALVALGAGAITFPQAAALVIGMDVGTTFTAAVATIGGSTASRRTGYAHVVYNCMTGVMAFALLTPYTSFVSLFLSFDQPGDAQLAVVGFHTLFNALGVFIIIGFAEQFGRLIVRLVPESGPDLQHRLDERLLQDPMAALDAVEGTLDAITGSLVAYLDAQLSTKDRQGRDERNLRSAEEALNVTYAYVARLRASGEDAHRRHESALHVLDHLTRLLHRCRQSERISGLRDILGTEQKRLLSILKNWDDTLSVEEVEALDDLRKEFRARRYTFRDQLFSAIVDGAESATEIVAATDSVRWLHRVTYHIWRIAYHFQRIRDPAQPETSSERVPELVDDVD